MSLLPVLIALNGIPHILPYYPFKGNTYMCVPITPLKRGTARAWAWTVHMCPYQSFKRIPLLRPYYPFKGIHQQIAIVVIMVINYNNYY